VGGLSLTVHAAETSSQNGVGTASEPVRYMGNDEPDYRFHDGALPPAVGVHNIQVMRANRSQPNAEGADGLGWTYNHAPMLCYWNGTFYLEYLSNPVGEHIPPGHTLLVESTNGYHWSQPRVVFPSYKISDELGMSVSHQRMGFHVAPDGRLLVLSFYGVAPRPNDGRGIGRGVRELQKDGTLGPIYFIRYNRHAGWNQSNTPHPFYKASEDAGFVAACDALLADKLMTQQWWEEDRSEDGFYSIAGRDEGFDAKALSFYHRKDGAVVGLWKKRWTALSFDEGKTWSEPAQSRSIVTGGAKMWGQRTDDGRYALVYNPHPGYRYPLVVVSGEDGIRFDDMLVVHGEVPYPRFDGQYKSLGPQYVRGIAEGNGNPPGDDLWLTYSMNKEDMWVSRVPVPIHGGVGEAINDDFDGEPAGVPPRGWNVYSPIWAPVAVTASPDGADGRCLKLQDEDRYDFAKVERIFPAARKFTLEFRIRAEEIGDSVLEIEVLDLRGRRPVRLKFGEGELSVLKDGFGEEKTGATKLKEWTAIRVEADAERGRFDLSLNGRPVLENAAFAEATDLPLERLRFRTGPIRDYDAIEADEMLDEHTLGDRLDGDEKVARSVFYVDDVRSR
jgi:hypothetical protein